MLTAIRWQARQLLPINMAAVACLVLYTLFTPSAITFVSNEGLAIGVLIHCLAMTVALGRSALAGPGFLYSQGLSRDQLWWSTFAATVGSGALICIVFWLMVITGIRATVQQACGNPWFPVVGTMELTAIKWLLLEYGLLLPPLHYVWIRTRQPYTDSAAGWLIAIALVIFYMICFPNLRHADDDWLTLMTGAGLLLAGIMVAANWKLHRYVEVQS